MRKTIWVVGLALIILSCSTPKKTVVNGSAIKPENKAAIDTSDIQNQFQYLFVEGLKQKMLGNPQEAVKYFSGCLELDPNSAAAMFELANIHAGNNDFTSASLLLEKAVGTNPGNKWYKLVLARIYQQSKKFDLASKVYNELIKQEPDNLDYLYMDAMMLSGSGKKAEAIEVYRQIEKKVGLNEQVSVALQQLLVESGKIKEAFAEIQKLIDSNPDDSKYYGLLADMYLSQGDKTNALKNYNKILEKDPGNGFVHFSLANYYQEEGDLVKSFEHTKKGFASPEVELEIKLQLYFLLTSNPQGSNLSNEKSEELIRILIEQHSDDSRVFMVNAEYLINNNQLKEAREQLKKVVAIGKADYIIYERIMYIDNDRQDWEALYSDSREAISLFPNQPQVYFLNGVACIQLEKYNEAFEICTEGLDYVVDNLQQQGQMILLQGEAKYKLGNSDEAFRFFDKAVELDPDNYIALNNYAYYLSLKGVDLDKAERMSGRVIELFPDNSTYLDTHAWVLFKKKNYQLAKFYMESAIKNGGEDNPVLLEHYGDILIMLEKTAEAKEYWMKAKEKGNDSSVLNQKISELKYYENTEE